MKDAPGLRSGKAAIPSCSSSPPSREREKTEGLEKKKKRREKKTNKQTAS